MMQPAVTPDQTALLKAIRTVEFHPIHLITSRGFIWTTRHCTIVVFLTMR